MDSKNGCISIIIPVYKVEDYLDRCLESVVAQNYSNLEIIVVDDGSPDRCPQMCDMWAKKDKRIQVLHKKNEGLSLARNVGIQIATGEYILFVDSDDYIVKDACERLYKYANGVDLVVGEATIYEHDTWIPRTHSCLKENYVYSGGECAIKEIRGGEWYAAACYNMYRREFLLENDLFFVPHILHEDIDYLPRLFLAAKTIKYINYEFYKYISRDASICNTKSEKHFGDLMITYSSWAKLNETIRDPELKHFYCGALVKYFMASCRSYNASSDYYPDGINAKYLLKNALNMRDFFKAVLFVFARDIYVHL